MIINGNTLLLRAPILYMLPYKERSHGVTHGLGEAGYDIRIKQTILFHPDGYPGWGEGPLVATKEKEEGHPQLGFIKKGRFTLASAMEEFDMPDNLVGVVHDKSTWARRGLSVFNTVIEPGWRGFLTLELVYHGNEPLTIPAGAGIAQVLFHQISDSARYRGRYQNQADHPVAAIKADPAP